MTSDMKTISVLGSAGSIGTQTLDVIRANPSRYVVKALGGNSSVDKMAEQAKEFSPEVIAVSNEENAKRLEEMVPAGVEILAGKDALCQVAGLSDITVNAVVGFAGLKITLETLKAGKRLALANKESLIAAAPLVNKVLLENSALLENGDGAELIPIDSEHCAIHQCLRSAATTDLQESKETKKSNTGKTQEETTNENMPEKNMQNMLEKNMTGEIVRHIILTASGGPFRTKTTEELKRVTLAEALNHPTWDMGEKITVDSSTLMNKGLEVIEANALFSIPYEQIKVVIHPQSIIHSMVEFSDGATVAQLSMPDMRLCIGYALEFPDRLKTPFGEIDWAQTTHLDFELPDYEKFPALALAFSAGKRGETAPCVLNASNEVANAAFLQEKIAWADIPKIVEKTLEVHGEVKADELDAIIEEDLKARETAEKLLNKI